MCNIQRLSSMTEDVKLSAHGRHPTTYRFYFFVCLFYFILCYFYFILFYIVVLVFYFLGTSVLAFKFGGVL